MCEAASVGENKRFFIRMFPPPPSTSINSILVTEGYALALKISLKGEKNLKIDTITTFSAIICTPEKGMFLNFYRTKKKTQNIYIWYKSIHIKYVHITDGVLKCEHLFQLVVLLQPCKFKDLTSCHCETFGVCLKYTTIFLHKNIPHLTSPACFERLDSTPFLQR